MDLLRKLKRHHQAKLKKQNNTEKTLWKGMVNNMKVDDYLQEQLKNPEFKKEWDDIQPEMDVIRTMMDIRIEKNLTQKDLAKKTGLQQADISRLENGTRNPSLKMLKRLADGMGMELKISFVPKVRK